MTDFDNRVRRVRRLAERQDLGLHKFPSSPDAFFIIDPNLGGVAIATEAITLDEAEGWLTWNMTDADHKGSTKTRSQSR